MTICVVGTPKGGVGKSSISINLAAIAAARGIDVVLLDTDETGSARGWAQARREEGHSPDIPILGLPGNPAKELSSLSSRYELLIVDIGAQDYRVMMQCAALADIVLVPCGPDQWEADDAVKAFQIMEKMGHQHEFGRIPAYALLNKMPTHPRSREREMTATYLRDHGIEVFDSVLAFRSAYRNVGRSGKALHELRGSDRDSTAASEMEAVFDEIVRRLSKGEGK